MFGYIYILFFVYNVDISLCIYMYNISVLHSTLIFIHVSIYYTSHVFHFFIYIPVYINMMILYSNTWYIMSSNKIQKNGSKLKPANRRGNWKFSYM